MLLVFRWLRLLRQPRLKADIPASLIDFRFAPGSRHPVSDVRFAADFVRSSPRSGHASDCTRLPLLTQSGHFAGSTPHSIWQAKQ